MIAFLLATSFFIGCNQPATHEQKEVSIEEKLQEQFNIKQLAEEIEKQFEVIEQDSFGKFKPEYLAEIKAYYESRNYEPQWIHRVEYNEQIAAILFYIARSDEHAFDPDWYQKSSITQSIATCLSEAIHHGQLNYTALARAEILTSEAVSRYASHIRHGLENPRRLYSSGYYLPYDSVVDYYAPLKAKDVRNFLADIQPKSQFYKALQKAYKEQKAKIGTDTLPAIHMKTKKIEPGDTSDILNLIATRLISLGIMEPTGKDFTTYDSTLVEAVVKFQDQQHLIADGVIGKRTIKRMNITPEEKVDLIRLNLERLRWLELPNDSMYILVNIPAFRMFFYKGDSLILTMKTCVGQRKTQTPQLTGELAYMVLNPTWSIPRSIATKEMIYKIKKDPTYLQRHRYNVYKNGQKVSDKDVNWQAYSADNLPFRFTQSPGYGNALGRVKFIFPNKADVYMHDTPSQYAFKNDNRAVSHGCIRLEKPIDLARALEMYTDIDEETREMIGKRGKSVRVNFKRKIPVYLDYRTAWVDEHGNLQISEDVYGKDDTLRVALARRYQPELTP